MSLTILKSALQIRNYQFLLINQIRCTNSVPDFVLHRHRRSQLNKDRIEEDAIGEEAPRHFKHVYPEFLPNPTPFYRDAIREKLERKDMLKRRSVINIPEFYVGSIMAVTISDRASADKKTRFVGICTERGEYGTRAWFTLRNYIQGQGVEITYHLYHPKIQKIEVLKLEKRLDDNLAYLKDAPTEYSSIPQEFKPVIHPPGAPVPVNKTIVKMNPYPWFTRWELLGFKGMDYSQSGVWDKRLAKVEHPQNKREWEKYDLMKWYRESIDEDTQEQIFKDVDRGLKENEKRKKTKEWDFS